MAFINDFYAFVINSDFIKQNHVEFPISLKQHMITFKKSFHLKVDKIDKKSVYYAYKD